MSPSDAHHPTLENVAKDIAKFGDTELLNFAGDVAKAVFALEQDFRRLARRVAELASKLGFKGDCSARSMTTPTRWRLAPRRGKALIEGLAYHVPKEFML